MGGGFFNSDWMAAIDNAGETLVLHNRSHIKLISKPYPKQVKQELEGDGTINMRKHKDLISNVHIYTGYKYADHSILQVGNLCPDEILELALDERQPKPNQDGTQSHQRSDDGVPLDSEEHIAKVLRAEQENETIHLAYATEKPEKKEELPQVSSSVLPNSMDIKLDVTSSANSLHVTQPPLESPQSQPNPNLKVEDLEAA